MSTAMRSGASFPYSSVSAWDWESWPIEQASDEAQRLMNCGRAALRCGLEAIRTNRPLVDWARAVQKYVETECAFHLGRGLGGHGYGPKPP